MGEERRHNFRPTMPESNRMCRNGCNYLPFSLRWLHADSLLKVSQGTKESRREALLSLIERATGKAVYRGETSDEPEGIQRTALMPDETAVKRKRQNFPHVSRPNVRRGHQVRSRRGRDARHLHRRRRRDVFKRPNLISLSVRRARGCARPMNNTLKYLEFHSARGCAPNGCAQACGAPSFSRKRTTRTMARQGSSSKSQGSKS